MNIAKSGTSTSSSVPDQTPPGSYTPIRSTNGKRKRVASGGTSSPPKTTSETDEDEVGALFDAEIAHALAKVSLSTCDFTTTRIYFPAVNLEPYIASTEFASTLEGAAESTGPKDATRLVQNPLIRFAASCQD